MRVSGGRAFLEPRALLEVLFEDAPSLLASITSSSVDPFDMAPSSLVPLVSSFFSSSFMMLSLDVASVVGPDAEVGEFGGQSMRAYFNALRDCDTASRTISGSARSSFEAYSSASPQFDNCSLRTKCNNQI
jgi:hypothetical protein